VVMFDVVSAIPIPVVVMAVLPAIPMPVMAIVAVLVSVAAVAVPAVRGERRRGEGQGGYQQCDSNSLGAIHGSLSFLVRGRFAPGLPLWQAQSSRGFLNAG